MRRPIVLALVAVPAWCAPLAAADLPETPPPGVLSADIGAALLREPVFAGSARETLDAYPVLGFKYGTRLQGSLDDGLRWTAFDLAGVKLGPVLEYRQADRLKRTIGFPGMRNAIEAGGFAEVDTPVADFEARVRHALTGYDGWSADLAADVGGPVGRRIVLEGEARLSYAGYQFVRREYGPSAEHPGEPIGRPYYLTAGAQAQAQYHVTRRLDLSASYSLDRLLDTVSAPAIRDHLVCQLATSLSLHFGPRTS